MNGFWFPAPEENIEVTTTPWLSQNQSLGGFHFHSESEYKPRRWSLQWNNLNLEQVNNLQNWLNHGARQYGRRVMFANPFAFANPLSPFFRDPWLFVASMSPMAWSPAATTTVTSNGLPYNIGQIGAYDPKNPYPTLFWRAHTQSGAPLIYDEFVPVPPYMHLRHSIISALTGTDVVTVRGNTSSLDPVARRFQIGANATNTPGIRISSASPVATRGFARIVIQVPSGGGAFSGMTADMVDIKGSSKIVDTRTPGYGWGNVEVDPQSVSITLINAAKKRYSARFEVYETWPW